MVRFLGWTSSNLVHPSTGTIQVHNRCPATHTMRLLRVCVIGSGPSGFYAMDRVLQELGIRVRIDLYERLPTPFGLVRSGVAPDHPDTKSCTNRFTRILQDERVRFFGNVKVGEHIDLESLRKCYDATILASGAEDDRKLGVPGEDKFGVHSAREFVWWYNGHPEHKDLPIQLEQVEDVAIFGIGNVSIDCARMLLKPWKDLQETDIAQHAIQSLQQSRVKRVHLLGRRGPAHASFTPKELRELLQLEDVSVHVREEDLRLSKSDESILGSNRIRRRAYEALKKVSQDDSIGRSKRSKQLHVHFYRSPTAFLGPDDRLEAARLEVNEIEGDPPRAVGTGRYETLPCEMALRSIGYIARPLEGVPFDPKRGVIPNRHGRVLMEGRPIPGLYTCGWIRRGASGIIGSNLLDAQEVAACVSQDWSEGRLPTPPTEEDRIPALLKRRGARPIDFHGWMRIDEEEKMRGKHIGKPREKLVDVEEMLRVAGATS